MNPLTIRELDREDGVRRFGVRLFESENVLTEEQLRELRGEIDRVLASNSRRWDWESDLLYISRAKMPIWAGVLKYAQAGMDASLKHMIDNAYIKQVGLDGFVITDMGREYLLRRGIR